MAFGQISAWLAARFAHVATPGMEAATGVALADVAIGHWRRRLVEERPQAFITGGCPYALKDNARIGEVAGEWQRWFIEVYAVRVCRRHWPLSKCCGREKPKQGTRLWATDERMSCCLTQTLCPSSVWYFDQH